MTVRLGFFALVLAGGVACAQTAAPMQLLTVPGAGPGGGPGMVLANTGTQTVTAFVVSFSPMVTGRPPRSPQGLIQDMALGGFPILPGRKAVIGGLPSLDPAKPAPQIAGVIFEDGSTWGDPDSVLVGRDIPVPHSDWFARTTQMRTCMLQRFTESLDDLLQAQKAEGKGLAAVTAQLQSAMEAALSTSAGGMDGACIKGAREIVLFNLRHAKGYEGRLDDLLKNQIDALNMQLVALRSYGNVQ